jgi:organic radical activating enzyme
MAELVEIKQMQPSLYLTWVINNICTNQCSYCPPVLHDGKNHHYDWNDARRFSQYLIQKYPKIHLAISGGEPTLSPFLPDLVDMFYQAGHPVGITSNGSRTVRYYESLAKKLSYVCLSYHPSFPDHDFVNKALVCGDYTRTVVHVMMDSRYFDQCMQKYHEFCSYETLIVEPVRINEWLPGNKDGRDYTPKQLDILKNLPGKGPTLKHPKRTTKRIKSLIGADFYMDDGTVESDGNAQVLMNQGKNRFKGWQCNIGIESLFVHYYGAIQRGNCPVGEPTFIGNVKDLDAVNWPSDPVICTEEFCICTTDIAVSKKKISDIA